MKYTHRGVVWGNYRAASLVQGKAPNVGAALAAARLGNAALGKDGKLEIRKSLREGYR
jgi:hypothetical protein